MTSCRGFLICVLWFFINALFSQALAVEVNMEGTGFITYDLRFNSIAAKSNHITFSFKTFRPSGLMVHSSGSHGDLITIELIHGRLRFTINLGSSKTISGKHTVLIGSNLSDNKWHQVKVDRNQHTLVVTVDKLRSQTTTPGSFIRLNLDRFVYVGGLDPRVSSGAPSSRNFYGCLKNLYFDFIDIFYGAKMDDNYYDTHGLVRFHCPDTSYVPVSFPEPDTHLKLNKHSPKNFSVELSFRTYDGDGILVYKKSARARLYLSLVSGRLELEVRLAPDKPIKMSFGESLNDGMWHDVIARVTRKDMWLQLDRKPELRHENPWLADIGDFRSRVYIGYGTQNTGFVGCMHRIKLNGNLVKLTRLRGSRISGAVINRCEIMNRCFPNPCRNGGRCLQTWQAFRCDCGGTFYHGDRCNIPLYRATCQEYKALGMVQDAYCKVDPDGTGPLGTFDVLCNMTASDAAKTVINHDKEEKHQVPLGAMDLGGYYFQRISYVSNLTSIRALIQRSANCRQFIRYDCYNSKLLNSPIGPEHVQWLSSTAVAQTYWGGAPAGSNKCACGVKKTCADPSKYCNCDADSDDKWREDSGYLTDKSLLPVNMLQFPSDAKDSFFTLGPLECFGSSGQSSGKVSNANFISSACRLVNPPHTVDITTTLSAPLTASRTKHGTQDIGPN